MAIFGIYVSGVQLFGKVEAACQPRHWPREARCGLLCGGLPGGTAISGGLPVEGCWDVGGPLGPKILDRQNFRAF